jgi:hypothetical protein
MDSDDLYQLFIKYDVPGFCKEVGRLALGVNMGDAGVINEALQARYDPSAGQRTLQDASPVLLVSHVPVNASAGEEEGEEARLFSDHDTSNPHRTSTFRGHNGRVLHHGVDKVAGVNVDHG